MRGWSPCVDAGLAEDAPGVDIDGVERPQGAGVDMGAYEYVFISDDVNLDSKVDSADADAIKNYLCKNIGLTQSQLMIADINKDGKVDIGDVVAMINLINN